MLSLVFAGFDLILSAEIMACLMGPVIAATQKSVHMAEVETLKTKIACPSAEAMSQPVVREQSKTEMQQRFDR